MLRPSERGLAADLREEVRYRPVRTLSLGALVGYALGGGIGVRLAGALLMTAGRAALWSALTTTLTGSETSPRPLRS